MKVQPTVQVLIWALLLTMRKGSLSHILAKQRKHDACTYIYCYSFGALQLVLKTNMMVFGLNAISTTQLQVTSKVEWKINITCFKTLLIYLTFIHVHLEYPIRSGKFLSVDSLPTFKKSPHASCCFPTSYYKKKLLHFLYVGYEEVLWTYVQLKPHPPRRCSL